MSKLIIPPGYKSKLNLYETQTAIGQLKRIFEDNLSQALNLKRVSAPLFVEAGSGLNDDLDGIQRPVGFDIKETGREAQIVQSLAKWKRLALYRYGFPVGEGIYTDMNAIRRDDEIDNIHSVYVDQWDWEKVIDQNSRSEAYLKQTVNAIINAICITAEKIKSQFPAIDVKLNPQVKYITAQELEEMYPAMDDRQREYAMTKEYGTVFLMQIGHALKSGQPHGHRAPDYDDWTLNGDILFWNDVLGEAIELSSMAIRVTPQVLDNQLSISGCDYRRGLSYHKMLLSGSLPLTIGGGIGQSRLSMLLLQKAHIGEVQAGVWDDETLAGMRAAGVELL
ncbi:MAG: aspartate--ammonia ligase [Defluviitaleaceae bacterium]|nr:aspartate--ammonia ligase [Defluviitaleaceae bacterium]